MHSPATFDLSSDPQLSDNNKPGVWKFRSTEAHCENLTKREGRMNEQVGIVHIVQFKLIRETYYCDELHSGHSERRNREINCLSHINTYSVN